MREIETDRERGRKRVMGWMGGVEVAVLTPKSKGGRAGEGAL